MGAALAATVPASFNWETDGPNCLPYVSEALLGDMEVLLAAVGKDTKFVCLQTLERLPPGLYRYTLTTGNPTEGVGSCSGQIEVDADGKFKRGYGSDERRTHQLEGPMWHSFQNKELFFGFSSACTAERIAGPFIFWNFNFTEGDEPRSLGKEDQCSFRWMYLGFIEDEELATQCTAAVKARAEELGSPLSDEDLALVSSMMMEPGTVQEVSTSQRVDE